MGAKDALEVVGMVEVGGCEMYTQYKRHKIAVITIGSEPNSLLASALGK